MNKLIEEQLKQFREKYEGANTGGAISSRQMNAMIQDLKSSMERVEEHSFKKGQSFAYHACDCVWCHNKNLEVLNSLQQKEE